MFAAVTETFTEELDSARHAVHEFAEEGNVASLDMAVGCLNSALEEIGRLWPEEPSSPTPPAEQLISEALATIRRFSPELADRLVVRP